MIQGEGYSVTTADNGKGAIDLVHQTLFDLVITDLVMPAIDGMQVLQSVKKIRPDTMVIILTGQADLAATIEALRLDADDFLLKPCDPQELFFRIKKCFEKLESCRKLRRAEEELRKYEHIVSATQECLSFVDCNYVYQAVNDFYLQAVKKRRDEIIGHSVIDVFGQKIFEEKMRRNFDRAFRGEKVHYQALSIIRFSKTTEQFPVYRCTLGTLRKSGKSRSGCINPRKWRPFPSWREVLRTRITMLCWALPEISNCLS
jgi:YesN/AraC family two-component response regulator